MASDQLAYAPARSEGDLAQERDDFRLPRQRGAAAPAFEALAGPGAAGLAPAPALTPATAPLPAPMQLADAGPGAALARPATYDPTALTGPVPAPLTPAPVELAPARLETVEPAVRPAPEPAVAEPEADSAPATAMDTATDTGTGTDSEMDSDTEGAGSDGADGAAPTDPGEALCARLLGQVAAQREAVARAEREQAEEAAAAQAAREAAERKVREQVAAAKAAAEEKAREEAEAAARAEAERLARLAASYIKPVACGTLGAGFGEADPWANLHSGQDFTAPTGTPVHAVHGGTVTSAGWAGSDGYRVVLTLDDGIELRFCHLSTMVVTSGRVTTGDTIGRVGATGNVPAPHLHLEVRPGGGAPVDPLPWLRGHEVAGL